MQPRRPVGMKALREPLRYTLFPSELGWMGLLGSGATVYRLTFGHKAMTAAREALGPESRAALRDNLWFDDLVERLQAYAGGARDAFLDVTVADDHLTPFQRQVVEECRRIPPGTALTYGDLAKAVGRAGAARAVGNVMRTNRVPLIVPCHRVVGSGGKLHGYSALGGLKTKRKILEMEFQAWVWEGVTAVTEQV
ncbi:MAG: methylated-DNA--[protein]-cysteine S-methyltransferase [Planctomycetes bacterium]|nr:methylated-DNA--[protein]-cysteine S-methyltransferase [Planctomycetota bacterium]